ncbi:rhomboid family intramembrane serine protease, partial [Rodentibacter caecimuris]|uniref:rhomboid family intramembrane serine protease n=1 Tax=Rodentibacter caecimuris TaxID=1796644 RepID=UPI00101AD044
VYAVLGYVFVVDKLNANIFNLPKGFFTMLLVGLIFGFISPLFDIYIGNAAHISGFIAGLFWGFIDSKIYLNRVE